MPLTVRSGDLAVGVQLEPLAGRAGVAGEHDGDVAVTVPVRTSVCRPEEVDAVDVVLRGAADEVHGALSGLGDCSRRRG